MKGIAVYCGSSSGNDGVFEKEARTLGARLAQGNIQLIYGGAKVGLMGSMADEVLKAGGTAIGVIPRFLSSKEVAHDRLSELILVDTMHERKAEMYRLAGAFVALPGGFGTMEELFEMLTWGQLGLHQKPIGILNTKGYYNALIAQIETMVQNGFLSTANQKLVMVSEHVEELMDMLSRHQPSQGTQWIKDVDQT